MVWPWSSRLRLGGKFLHGRTKLVGVHAVDDGVAFRIELLLDRRDRRSMDQRLGRRQAGRRLLRQAKRELARRGLQLRRRDELCDQAPVMGLLRGKTVFGEVDLER